MRPSRHPRRVLGLVVAGALSAGFPLPAAAADPIALPGDTILAVAADLDGDGAREVVQMVRPSLDAISVEVWRERSGRWDPAGRADVSTTQRPLPAVAMLRARVEGRDHVIVLTAQPIPADEFARTCCLSLASITEDRGRVTLEPLAVDGLDPEASALRAIDFDGDGTDELLTVRTTLDLRGSAQTHHLEIHAWRGSGYVRVGGVSLGGRVNSIVQGETDGTAGLELLYGPDQAGIIRRLALLEGELRVEEGPMPNGDRYVVGVAGELMILSDGATVSTVRWPPGGAPREINHVELGADPLIQVVGEGPDALLVNLRGSPQGAETDLRAGILDLELRQVAEVSAAPAGQEMWRFLEHGLEGSFVGVSPYPYLGPLPPELAGGRAAYSGGGVLIAQDGDGGFESKPMSPLAGLFPIGTAGLDDRWLAVSNGRWSGPPNAVQLGATASSLPSARLLFLRVDDVMEPQPSLPASVELAGAVFAADGEQLLSGPDGFDAVVDAPPGTLVVSSGVRIESHEVDVGPLTVAFTHRSGQGDRNSDFAYGLMAVLPDGRVLLETWDGTVVREPPSLEATAATTTFELGARVTGTTSPYAELAVDGRPVEVGVDGAFEVAVDAPPWPVDVLMVARDPLGNETSSSIQVIGFVDYRGLPWLPIMGLITALVGAYALLRVPRRRPVPMSAWSDEGTLEEIELD